jgi:nucleotide sugar dehydrogenase
MKTIAIIGRGYVGNAMFGFFENHYNMMTYDLNPEVCTHSIEEINEKADCAVVCLPTEMLPDGSCDISLVENAVSKLETDLIIIKSTVAVGTTKALAMKYNKKIVFSPEFAGESKYWSPYKFDTDVKEMPHYIFGGNGSDCSQVLDLYMKVGGPTKRYLVTDHNTAEMVKYVANTFYATKVTFCNEMYDICKALGTDWNRVRELWLNDPRVNRMHTAVFANNRGYGGKCFPKDVNAMIKIAEKADVKSVVLNAVNEANDNFRNKNES